MKSINKKTIILLTIIFLLQLARIIYVFQVEKTGSHSDESWSFGLANSYYKPHIFMDEDWNETYRDEWISGQTLKDYICVNEDQRFSYGSVIHNLKNDAHPPLYFLILHTISSFFPGQYSRWYSFVINLAVFIPLMLLLFALARKLFKSDIPALAVVFYYGFSFAGVNTFVFLRSYAMLTMFAVLFVLLHLKLTETETGKKQAAILAGIAVVSFLGILTHYFFLPLAFAFAALFCIGWLIKKNWKKLFPYAAVMLSSVVLSFPLSNMGKMINSQSAPAAETSAVETLSSGVTGALKNIFGIFERLYDILYNVNFQVRINTVINDTLYDLFGINANMDIPYIVFFVIFYGLLLFVVWCLLSLVIVRLPKGNDSDILPKAAQKTLGMFKKLTISRFFWITMLASVLFVWWFVIGFAQMEVMKAEGNRYYFLIYPLLVLLIVKLVFWAVGKICKNANLIGGLTIVLITACNMFFGNCVFLYPRPERKPMFEEMAKGNDVILMNSQHWLLTCYTTLLYEAEDIFVTTTEDVVIKQAEQMKKADSDNVVILVDAEEFKRVYALANDIDEQDVRREQIEKKWLPDLEKIFPERNIQYVYEDKVFKRPVYVYSCVVK